MDTKRLITLMLISFAVIFGWQILIFKLYPPKPPGAATPAPSTTAPAGAVATTPAAATTGPGAVAGTQPAQQMLESAVRVIAPATQPYVATIGVDAGYPMVVNVSSAGAGLDSVTLKEFRAPGGKGDYVFQQPY